MTNFSPKTYTSETLAHTTEYRYIYGSISEQRENNAVTGLRFEFSANTNFLDYFELDLTRFRNEFEQFAHDINEKIQREYIAQTIAELDKIIGEKFGPENIAEFADFIASLVRYRDGGADTATEKRAYTAQIKYALNRFDIFIDFLRDKTNAI